MSQYATELCLLLVDDIYGDLTSRVFATLISYGRLTVAKLQNHTGLGPRQLRHALAVLVQQHLAFWYTAFEATTFYEANWAGAYALARQGKFAKAVEGRLGSSAAAIISTMLLSGHARIADLAQAHRLTNPGDIVKPLELEDVPDGTIPNVDIACVPNGHSDNHNSFQSTLDNLLDARFLSIVNESHFRSNADNRSEAEVLVKSREKFKGELKGMEKIVYAEAVDKQLLDWRFATAVTTSVVPVPKAGNHVKGKKRKAAEEAHDGPRKRQRSDNIMYHKAVLRTPGADSSAPCQDQETVLRANPEKLAIVTRNEKLTELASQRIGKTTARVYTELLLYLENDLECCNIYAGIEDDFDPDDDFKPGSGITTLDMAGAMAKYADIGDGIGHADPNKIDLDMIIHRKERCRKYKSESQAILDADNSTGDEDESDNEVNGHITETEDDDDHVDGNADYTSEVKVDKDGKLNGDPLPQSFSHTGPESCLHQTRQHLFLLAEHPYAFVTYIRRRHSTPESWTVNFRALSHQLRILELEKTIIARYGVEGLRIVRILQEKGKLDEKALAALALMNQKTMRSILTTMHEAGHLELQEVPRDSMRAPSRAIYLWFFDPERCGKKVLEETYKAMARCLERSKVEREGARGIIEKASRTDVVGKEEEFLAVEERATLEAWRVKEEKLLGEVDKLDDLVMVLRDF